MGIRPAVGVGAALPEDKIPVLPNNLREKIIVKPPENYWDLPDPHDVTAFLAIKTLWENIKRKSYDLEEDTTFQQVFIWPDDEYCIPDWLVFPYGDYVYAPDFAYALAAIHNEYWKSVFVPMPSNSSPEAMVMQHGLQYIRWKQWKETQEDTDLEFIKNINWLIENDHCYQTMTDDARWHILAMQRIFKEEDIILSAKDIRFGLYVRWS